MLIPRLEVQNAQMAAHCRRAEKKKPQLGLGGLGPGLLIFETTTHPVTVDITIDRRIRFPPSWNRSDRRRVSAFVAFAGTLPRIGSATVPSSA